MFGAVVALAILPVSGLGNTLTARAATMTTVSPDAMNGWLAVDDNGKGGSLDFINTHGSVGTGSAQLTTSTSLQGYMMYKPAYGGMKLVDMTSLSYDTYVKTGNNMIAPALQFDIDKDVTDADVNWQGRLVSEPYRNGSVVDGQWQSQSALSGKWWFSKPASFDGNCSQASPCTLDTITTLYGSIGVRSVNGGGVGFKAGSGWNVPFEGGVDNFVINGDVYNFEAIAAPQLESPANNVWVQGATLVNKWSPVVGATKYKYESYHDAGATNQRWSQVTTDTQKSATNVADGTVFWWRVKAIDAQGNEGRWSELWKVVIDNTAPSVPTGGAPHEAFRKTNEFDFTWNESTDNTAGNVRYEFRSSQDSSQLDTVPASSMLNQPKIHSSGAVDGIWYWQVRAIDVAGNKSAWSAVWNMTIDTQAPTLMVNTPYDGEVFGGVGKKQITVTSYMEDAWGLQQYFIDINPAVSPLLSEETEETEEETPELATSASLDVIAIFNADDFEDGEYVITVRVTDKAGNVTEENRTIVIQHATVVVPGQGSDAATSDDSDVLAQLTQRLTQPFSVPYSFASSTGGSQTSQEVLGLEDGNEDDVASGEQIVAAAPSTEGWKLFGVAWYWWLLLVAIVGVASAWIVRRVRASSDA